MIEERRQDVCEYLKDSDDEDAHDHPLPDLLCKRRLNYFTEEQAKRNNDGGNNNSRPYHETFAERADVHGPVSLNRAK